MDKTGTRVEVQFGNGLRYGALDCVNWVENHRRITEGYWALERPRGPWLEEKPGDSTVLDTGQPWAGISLYR